LLYDVILQFIANPARTANSKARLLITGSVPGIPKQIGHVQSFADAPKV
jgi:hypothetical protein